MAGSGSGLTSPRAGERAEGAVPSLPGVTSVPPLSPGAAAPVPRSPQAAGPSRGALRGPTRTPGRSHRRAGAPRLRGEGGGIGTPIPPSPTRRLPHAPLPSQLCGRGLSPPTSALPCGRRVHLHIRVRAGPCAAPLAAMLRRTRSLTSPARGRRGSAPHGLSEPAWAGPAGPGGVRDARCGWRRRPRGPPWCEALPR